MFRKTIVAVCCLSLVSAIFTGCGKEIEIDDISQASQAETSSSSESTEIVPVANYTAPEQGEKIITMNIRDYGTVKIKLFPEYAGTGVENFIGLAEKGYYDGLTFHRVISDFMIQGGDPLGTGMGGESVWGGSFDGGTDPHLIHTAGALAYANSDSTATDGSQFYIVTGSIYSADKVSELDSYYGMSHSDEQKQLYSTVGGAPWLDGGYTVFGQVFEGLDVIFKVQNVSTDENNMPLTPVYIDSVTVEEYNGEELKWYLTDYEGYEELQSSSQETVVENVPVMNFTAPEDGEKVIDMNIKDYGHVMIKLFPEYAEKGVENFIGLAESGYYDGLTFHRVIEDFMIQGGDPNGTGTGGESIWGGKFDGGTDAHLIHAAGAVAYANSGSTSKNGSQFYIVTGSTYAEDDLLSYGYPEDQAEIYSTVGGAPWLDGGYTIFGQVYDGLDVVFEIQKVTTDTGNDKPVKDVIIESVTVGEYDGGEIRWYISDYDGSSTEKTASETEEETESVNEESETEAAE